MRLLRLSDDNDLSFVEDPLRIPVITPYEILSHTWRLDEEVTFKDLINSTSKNKLEARKMKPKIRNTTTRDPRHIILYKDNVSKVVTPSHIFEIPSYLNQNHHTNALGDYCAKFNFMREDYAHRLGLLIDRHQTHKVIIGSGKTTSTTGTAITTFRFQGESQSYPLTFHLLPNCIHNVILGKPFLKATRTFSNLIHFASRVKQRIMKGITQHHLFYLGDSTPRFQGLINGIPQEALADSGAKVMIMDEDYARSIGLYINSGSEHRIKLRFADNSTAYTSGMTHDVEWEFGFGEHSDPHLLDFYVLKNAPANVILSDMFLFGTKAFSQYDCYLVDDDDEDDDGYDVFFFAIDIDNSHLNRGLGANPSAADLKYFEVLRRCTEEDKIADLPLTLQAAAWVTENERRALWDQMLANLQLRPPNGLSPNPLSFTNIQAITGRPLASSPPGSPQPLPCSGSTTRFWQRFKLKRKNT